MISAKYICQIILKMEICISDLTAEEIDKISFGNDDVYIVKNKILYLMSGIDILNRYNPTPAIDSSKVKFSDKGRFAINGISLSLTPKKYKMRSDDVNCLTEEQICSLISNLLLICPNC